MIAIQLKNNTATYTPGEAIDGEVRWSDLGPRVDLLEIRLIWYTEGKGDRDVAILDRRTVAAPVAAGSHAFSFTAPDRPYSCSGKLVSLLWAIETIAFPSRDSESRIVVIGPERRGVKLGVVE